MTNFYLQFTQNSLRGVLQTKLRLSLMKESTTVANIPLCAELES